METIKIKPLDIKKMVDNNLFAFKYYRLHYNFNSIDIIDGTYHNIPIIGNALRWLTKIEMGLIPNVEKLVFPYEDYIQGFVSQYQKGMTKSYFNDKESNMTFILEHIKPNPPLPVISYIKDRNWTPHFDAEISFKYGEANAISYLAWEIVISELPTFDFVFKMGEKPTSKDWEDLYDDLINEYIKDTSPTVFNDVINYKRLPKGADKIIWISKKSEAVYFQKAYGFKMKNFNECFIHIDGKQFAEKNRPKSHPQEHFLKIIAKHKYQ